MSSLWVLTLSLHLLYESVVLSHESPRREELLLHGQKVEIILTNGPCDSSIRDVTSAIRCSQ